MNSNGTEDAEISRILYELGEDRVQSHGAVAPAIVQSSNFSFPTTAALRSAFKNEFSTYIYSRGLNPTVDILRKKCAALDGAEDALIFNSGAAAIFASVLSQVRAGGHVVSVMKPYSWAQKVFDEILARFDVRTTYVDGTDTENFARAIQPETTLIYLESPNSWDFSIQDLRAVATLAKSKGIATICDNSYATPLRQRPIELGIDLVLQSATKYIGGHSDVVAGVLTGKQELIEKIFRSEYMAIGSGIQPFNAWLLIRGLRTLPMRLEKSERAVVEVLSWLKGRPEVEAVLYPLDETFPQYALAKKQMNGAGGLLTFIMKGDRTEIEGFCDRLKHILIAVSWGSYESLIIPRCSTIPPELFDSENRDHRMVRLYVGLEDAKLLIRDLEQAFGR